LSFQHQYVNSANFKQKIDLDILKSQLEKISSLKLNFKIYFLPNINIKDIKAFYCGDNSSSKNSCNIPWIGLNILPNMEVTPGGGVLGCNQIIGNLKEKRMKKIWNNSFMRKFRKNIVKNGLPVICHRCCHRQCK